MVDGHDVVVDVVGAGLAGQNIGKIEAVTAVALGEIEARIGTVTRALRRGAAKQILEQRLVLIVGDHSADLVGGLGPVVLIHPALPL